MNHFDLFNSDECVFTGVPISTQWDKDGYYSSTQISQYGLAHWSKLVLAEKSGTQVKRTILDDGVSHFGDWIGDTTRVLSLSCLHFDRESEISLKNFDSVDPSQVVLGFDLQFGWRYHCSCLSCSGCVDPATHRACRSRSS